METLYCPICGKERKIKWKSTSKYCGYYYIQCCGHMEKSPIINLRNDDDHKSREYECYALREAWSMYWYDWFDTICD